MLRLTPEVFSFGRKGPLMIIYKEMKSSGHWNKNEHREKGISASEYL